jgi:hypothetical protein
MRIRLPPKSYDCVVPISEHSILTRDVAGESPVAVTIYDLIKELIKDVLKGVI